MDADITVGPSKEIMEAIEIMAAKMGVAADTIFPWYVEHQFITGVCSIITLIVPLILAATLIICNNEKADVHSEVLTLPTLLYIIGFLLLMVVSITWMLNFSSIMSHILVPEHAAIHTVLSDLAKFKP